MEYYVSIMNFQFWLRLQMSRKPHYPITIVAFCLQETVFCIYFKYSHKLFILETFTFMHLADAFIQSLSQSLGIEPTTFALLTQCSNHWATGTHDNNEHWNNDMN